MDSFKINTFILLFVLAQLVKTANSQNDYFSDPVDIPIFLSGNFCELRPNHFHGGLDFKTQQRTGLPIYAVTEGFISRIVVSPTGYGRALYVEHPNGTTSVYGHLLRFRADIEAYVKSEQYSKESFALDLAPAKNQFLVKTKEQIALSGNSGSSGGPHLHFEIRDTPTQDALNPLLYQFSVKDNVAPRIFGVGIHPLSDNGHVQYKNSRQRYTATGTGSTYKLTGPQVIAAEGRIGITLHVNDFYDGSHNPCGIYTASVMVNNTETFSFGFDRMPFSDTRYMNSHIDYEESVNHHRRVHRLWRQPGNRLRIYRNSVNNGIIQVEDGQTYEVSIRVTDIAGNEANVNFTLKGEHRDMEVRTPPHTRYFTYDEDNSLITPFIEFFATEGSFYDDFYFSYHVMEKTPEFFSKIHRIHSETVPIHHPVRLRLLAEGLPVHLEEKSFIGRISDSGGKSYAGGRKQGNWFETDIRTFGTYAIMADTIPPRIVPLSIRENNALSETSRIRFTVTDNLSGIKNYEGLIDGQWALFEYDQKNRLLTYMFDTERVVTGKRHSLILKVTDQVNNTAVYEATFWKE